MDTDNEIKINENAICILKFADNSQLVMVDYEPIIRTLDSEFNALLKIFELPYKDAKSIVTHIKNNYKLKFLFDRYNYCGSLSQPYQGLYSTVEEIEKKYTSVFNRIADIEEQKKAEKDRLLLDCNERLLAYYLDNTYKICEEKRKQNIVLAYSHRKVGWSTPKYILNENFSTLVSR